MQVELRFGQMAQKRGCRGPAPVALVAAGIFSRAGMMGETIQVEIWKQRMAEIRLRLQDSAKLSPMDIEGLKAEYRDIESLIRTFSP